MVHPASKAFGMVHQNSSRLDSNFHSNRNVEVDKDSLSNSSKNMNNSKEKKTAKKTQINAQVPPVRYLSQLKGHPNKQVFKLRNKQLFMTSQAQKTKNTRTPRDPLMDKTHRKL